MTAYSSIMHTTSILCHCRKIGYHVKPYNHLNCYSLLNHTNYHIYNPNNTHVAVNSIYNKVVMYPYQHQRK